MCSFLKSCVQFLVKCVLSGEAKGRHTYTECASRILVKGDVPTERVSRILVKGDVRCEGASPFYLICTKKVLQIILHGNAPCASTQGACWHGYAKRICANGHPAARHKKHRMEHKLSEIFKANGMSWV
jgi:hypothetical protein